MTYWHVTWTYEEGGRQELTSVLHRRGGALDKWGYVQENPIAVPLTPMEF